MTFSQAVETAQSRGAATDFVRHREVGDLYQRTGSIEPKLARSLDDAGRRERMSITFPLFAIGLCPILTLSSHAQKYFPK